jgi:WD40 repeat protein
VSGSDDETLRVWDSASGACLRVLDGHTSVVSSVCALGDGRIVSGSWDNTLRVWDPVTYACLETSARNSPRASELRSAALPGSNPPVCHGRTRAHCTLGGAAPLHLGAELICNALVILPTGVRVIVASTSSHTIHFLEVREPGAQPP